MAYDPEHWEYVMAELGDAAERVIMSTEGMDRESNWMTEQQAAEVLELYAELWTAAFLAGPEDWVSLKDAMPALIAQKQRLIEED